MRNLIYKELNLSINKFFYVLPLLLSFLFLIPQWIYSFVFMYFFWVTASQIFLGYTAQSDYSFSSMLPVTKKAIVQSKVIAVLFVEGVHLIIGVLFGIIHNLIYGSTNFLMDINPAFYGIMLITFGLFNIFFLPEYFKTAYKYGKPLIKGSIVTLLFAGFFEFSSIQVPIISNIIESKDALTQLVVLLTGMVVFVILNIISIKKSIKNYENIK